jgi:hypothetical protein
MFGGAAPLTGMRLESAAVSLRSETLDMSPFTTNGRGELGRAALSSAVRLRTV